MDRDKLREWLDRNWFRISRLIFALVVLATITIPLACQGRYLIDKDNIKELIDTTKTVTENKSLIPTKKGDGASEAAGKSNKNEEQITTMTVEVAESASLRVLAYGLQLVAWVGVVGVSLWAVVAFCRDE